MLFWFAALCVISVGLTAQVIRYPVKLYQFPYFIGFTFCAVLLPQAYSLVAGDAFPDQQLADLFCMFCLCLGCAWVGYMIVPKKATVPNWLKRPLDSTQLFWGSMVLIVIGVVFTLQFGDIPDGGRHDTGLATIYLFFGNWVYIGFGASVYGALKYGQIRLWLLSAVAAVVPIQAAVFYARREPTVLFTLSIAFAFFFVRRVVLPRALIAGAILLVVVFMPLTSAYRAKANEGVGEAVGALDLSDPLKGYREGTENPEMLAALYTIADARTAGDYGYGAGYWDQLVYRFVPAQFLGEQFKNSLLIGVDQVTEIDRTKDAYRGIAGGTTITGAGDAFQQFGFAGALFFGLMGFVFRGLWVLVHASPNPILHVFYANATVAAMHTVTHGTIDFLPGMIYAALALGFLSVLTPHRLIRRLKLS